MRTRSALGNHTGLTGIQREGSRLGNPPLESEGASVPDGRQAVGLATCFCPLVFRQVAHVVPGALVARWANGAMGAAFCYGVSFLVRDKPALPAIPYVAWVAALACCAEWQKG